LIPSTADTLFLVIGVIDISGLFAGIGYMLFLANTKMDILQSCFKNSWGVTGGSAFEYSGVWGRIMIIGRISGYVTFSTFYIKRGILSADDLKELPASLKRKLIALQWIGIILLIVMFGLAFIAELNVV
jgi:Trk-type K+ transport system membrane component